MPKMNIVRNNRTFVLTSYITPTVFPFGISSCYALGNMDLVRKSLNPCALLVPKIGIIRHQVTKIGGMILILI